MQDYVNTYYSLRYRAKEGTAAAKTVGAGWSGWTDEQLAEGWVQRVLNSVTPFAQRVEDFYSNPSDISFSMLEQIGRPYQGDVALSNENLKEVGLLELYQTIFNKAESILIAAGGENVDLSKQLILATTRMGEFYSLLGAEAYSDAKNPLVASADGEPTAAGVFCFANQVPTLLDEELALLRGRTSATQFPKLTAAPYFNRLRWNFTKGITEGEAAYVANYGVRATEGTIQSAYRDYIGAYQKLQNAMTTYQVKYAILDGAWGAVKEAKGRASATLVSSLVSLGFGIAYRGDADHWVDMLETEMDFSYMGEAAAKDAVANVNGVGMTIITDPQAIANAVKLPKTMTEQAKLYMMLLGAKKIAYGKSLIQQLIDGIGTMLDKAWTLADTFRELGTKMETAAGEVNEAASAIQQALAELTTAEAAYRAEIYKGEMLQEERTLWRKQVSNKATQQRYLDMFNRVQRNNALVKYSTAFDTAQRYVFELAKVYDYETGLLSSDPQSGRQFLADIVATRALGQEGVPLSSGTTDGGLWDVVTRMKANWDVLKGRLGVNNPDKPENWFSLRYERFRIKPDASGDEAWRRELRKHWADDIYAVPEIARHCQPLQSENPTATKEPGLVIPFATSINNAANFFGQTLQGGEAQFSSADYATKIAAVGVDFAGYDRLTTQTATGLATEPNIYLVPVGTDYMRAPAGTTRKVLGWNIVDQVMPLPYTIGSAELDDEAWIATMSGLDGTTDSAATIRRHSTLRAGSDFTSTRLVGRSVWNDRWLLVIPASSLNADRARALDTFINGVGDIKIGIRAYSRSGN